MEIKLAYGEGESGKLHHIGDVARGLACKCFCPACGHRLVARKGQTVQHHFAHYQRSQCSAAVETALHQLGKQVLLSEKSILMPAISVSHNGREYLVREEAVIELEDAQAERSMGDIRPDVIAHVAGKMLAIEVCVTHKVDEEKRAKLANKKLSTIEIFLPVELACEDESSVRSAVAMTARRQWAYSEAGDLFLRKLVARLRVEQRGLEARARNVLNDYEAGQPKVSVSREARSGEVLDKMRPLCWGLVNSTGNPITGWECYHFRPIVWQAIVLEFLLTKLRNKGASVSVNDVFKELKRQGLVRPGLSYVPSEVERTAREIEPGFYSAYTACSLAEIGFLHRRGFAYILHWRVRAILKQEEEYLKNYALPFISDAKKADPVLGDEKFAATKDEVELRIRRILNNALGSDQAEQFSFDDWFQSGERFEGKAIHEVLASSDAIIRLNDLLNELDLLSQGWAPHKVKNLLGLPLENLNRKLAQETQSRR